MSLKSSKFCLRKLVIPVEKLLVPVNRLVIPVDKFNVSPRNAPSTGTAIPVPRASRPWPFTAWKAVPPPSVARASCPWPGTDTAPGTESTNFPWFCQTFKDLHQPWRKKRRTPQVTRLSCATDVAAPAPPSLAGGGRGRAIWPGLIRVARKTNAGKLEGFV